MKILAQSEITEEMEVVEALCPTEEAAQIRGERQAANYTRRGFPYTFVGVTYAEYTSTELEKNHGNMIAMPFFSDQISTRTHRGYYPVVMAL